AMSAAIPIFRTMTKSGPLKITRSTSGVASWPGTTTKRAGMARTSSYWARVSETRSTHVSSAHSHTNASSSSPIWSKRAASSRIRSLIARNMTSLRARRASSDGGIRRSSHAGRKSLNAIDPVVGGDGARELELNERSRDLRGALPRPPDELVRRRRQQIEEPSALGPVGRLDAEAQQDVGRSGQRCRAELEQRIRARRQRRGDLARHGEDLAALLEREIGGDERTASLARLDNDRRGAEAGDDPIAGREAPGRRLDARRVLGDDQPVRRDAPGELGVR